MAFVKYDNEKRPATHTPCVHLRSKGLYVTGQWKEIEHPDEEGVEHTWCNLTQHILGPDQQYVGRCECGPDRKCYRDSY